MDGVWKGPADRVRREAVAEALAQAMKNHWFEEDGDYYFLDSGSGMTLRVETWNGEEWTAFHEADQPAFLPTVFLNKEAAMEYAESQLSRLGIASD